ncbi:MAG: hypothetical protein EXR71_01605 [Myxococcales bacterium]|nr:hypothetical protein [Myxococcales bacterium]
MSLLSALLLSGCDRLTAAGDVVDGLGDTTVAQAIFLGADIPSFVELPLDAEFYTSFCKVFLAEVTDVSDFTNSPVSGAEVRFNSAETGRLVLDEEEPGAYQLYSDDGLSYTPGQAAIVAFETGSGAGELRVEAPVAPTFSVSLSARAHEPVTLTVTEGEFPHLVALVYDLDHDQLAYDSLPDDVEAAYELNSAGAEPATSLIIPGEAFKRKSTYIIGLAGLQLGDSDGFEGVNQALSTFAAGQLGLQVVSVAGAVDGGP